MGPQFKQRGQPYCVFVCTYYYGSVYTAVYSAVTGMFKSSTDAVPIKSVLSICNK